MTRRDKAPNDGRAMTHDEIAARLGMARESVVRAEQRALAKLRDAIEREDTNNDRSRDKYGG